MQDSPRHRANSGGVPKELSEADTLVAPENTLFRRFAPKPVRRMVARARRRYRELSRRDLVISAVLVLLIYISNAMIFFGMNFWLWSFARGQPYYVSLVVPASLWCFGFLVPVLVVKALRPQTSIAFWTRRRSGIVQLVVIGFLDAMGGVTAVYAATRVPMMVQSMFTGTAPIWTYLLSRIVYRESARPCSPTLVVIFTLIAAGVAFSIVPQVEARNNGSEQLVNVGWMFVMLVSAICPPFYNVVQGKFLSDFKDDATPGVAKMVLLAGDCSFQLMFTLLFFPLDFAPNFGATHSASASWTGLTEAAACIRSCDNNAVYMMLYVVGYWLSHAVFSFVNLYSPTLGAVFGQLGTPINTFLLLAIPRWNVFGAPASWGSDVLCFLFLFVAMALYGLWHEAGDSHDNVGAGGNEQGAGNSGLEFNSGVAAVPYPVWSPLVQTALEGRRDVDDSRSFHVSSHSRSSNSRRIINESMAV